MTRPKLLFVVSEDWYFVSHRLALAKAASANGFDVMVATQVNAHGDEIADAGIGLRPIAMRRSTLNPIVAVRELSVLQQLYSAERPDIVHHVALKPIILGSRAAHRAGIKGIVNAIAGLGYAFTSNSLRARAVRFPLQRELGAALKAPNTRVIVQNRDDLNMLSQSGLAAARDIRLVPGSGVDVARFDLPETPPGPPLIVLPARLLKHKGVMEFVDAAYALKSAGVHARFALVGAPDPLNPTSVPQRQIECWRKEGVIEVWAWQGDMARVLAQATIVCLPSYREGLPKALLEAAAARRAIVTTDVPGCREIVRDGVSGWLVPPGDSKALALALRDAIENSTKRSQFVVEAYSEVTQRFGNDVINMQILAVYAELLKKTGLRPGENVQ